MILNISFDENVDTFLLSSEINSNIHKYFPISAEELVLYFQATLTQNKFVIFTEDKNSNPILEKLKAKHYYIEKNKFIFLNYSLKKKISQLKNSTIFLNNFQEVESYILENLSTSF